MFLIYSFLIQNRRKTAVQYKHLLFFFTFICSSSIQLFSRANLHSVQQYDKKRDMTVCALLFCVMKLHQFIQSLKCYFIIFFRTQTSVFTAWETHVPEITAADVMGTTCWPFNFIHVRGDGVKVSFIRPSSPSDCRYSAGWEKKKHRPWQLKPYRWGSTILFSQHKHPEHMVSSAKHSTKDNVDASRGAARETCSGSTHIRLW